MEKLKYLVALIALLAPLQAIPSTAQAQGDEDQRISELEEEVNTLGRRLADHGDDGVALFLCGSFCALWAQQTGRNAWLWFFAGAFFNIITLLVLLYKNSKDGQRPY